LGNSPYTIDKTVDNQVIQAYLAWEDNREGRCFRSSAGKSGMVPVITEQWTLKW